MENHLNTNKIPTAEEFYKQTTGCVMNHRDIKIAMIEFAKLHVEEALKVASEKAEWKGYTLAAVEICDYSILDAYPLENIK